jgi:hypothetical protein
MKSSLLAAECKMRISINDDVASLCLEGRGAQHVGWGLLFVKELNQSFGSA